jgi:hypothetical protein
MIVAVNYKLVLLLLEEIRKSDKIPAKCALLTRIMAEIGIQPKHRLSCVKMAIQKNLEARNFKTAARLIKVRVVGCDGWYSLHSKGNSSP